MDIAKNVEQIPEGTGWIDTSTTPATLKRWDSTAGEWVVVGTVTSYDLVRIQRAADKRARRAAKIASLS
jgi:hypothetical protein